MKYRDYLIGVDDDIIPPWSYPMNYMNTKLEKISLSEIVNYTENTIKYIDRFNKKCTDLASRSAIALFKHHIGFLKKDAKFDYDQKGKRNFVDVRNRLRQFAFSTEAYLVGLSLYNSNNIKAFFSDSGFADEGGNKAVWCDDPSRNLIIETLRKCKQKNNSLSYHRLLLLDSMSSKDYKPHQLYELSRDILYLLESYVDTSVGLKVNAKMVAPDLFNYAIIEDGTIMRASEDHSEWRIAKVTKSHPEFKKLLSEYNQIINDFSGKMLKFDYSKYIEKKGWTSLSEEEKIKNYILSKLLNWMV